MANIADLVVSLSADIASFRDGMAQSKKAVNDLTSEFASAKEAASSFIEKIGEIVAAREVVKFLEDSVEATRAWSEQLATFQGLAGLSSKEAATFAASAQLAGVQTDIVTTAMARLGTTIATHPQKFQQLWDLDSRCQRPVAADDRYHVQHDRRPRRVQGRDRSRDSGRVLVRLRCRGCTTQLDKLGPELKAGNWAENAEAVYALGLDMNDAKAQAEAWAKAQGKLKLELLGVENQIGQALVTRNSNAWERYRSMG